MHEKRNTHPLLHRRAVLQRTGKHSTPLYMKITEVMDSIGEPYEMVFVDDGSRDNTTASFPKFTNMTAGSTWFASAAISAKPPALKAGFDFARGEIIISMDGDLQHDPEEIPRFLEKIEEGFDLVSGWRHARRDHWLMRQVPSRVANWMMAKLSGIELHDFGTTFKAYRKRNLPGNSALRRTPSFHSCVSQFHRRQIAEVPISNPDRRVANPITASAARFRVFFDLLIVKFLLDYSTRPLQFFGLLGALGPGAVYPSDSFLAFTKFYYGRHHGRTRAPDAALGGALYQRGAVGLHGTAGEIIARTYYESQNKPIYSLREVKSHRKEMSDPAEPARPSGSSER